MNIHQRIRRPQLESWITIALGACCLESLAQSVPLQNATATYSQLNPNMPDLWSPRNTIDGSTSGGFTSWAIERDQPNTPETPNSPETIVWETVSDLSLTGMPSVKFALYHDDYVPMPGHNLGRFRLSYTTDDRSLFADGLTVGGDVSANWTVIVPRSVSSTEGDSFTVLADHSILVGGTLGDYPTYTILSDINATGITGFRLEALLDGSLPFEGPGRQPVNGNFHLSEFVVTAVPEPASYALMTGLGLLGFLAFRRRSGRAC